MVSWSITSQRVWQYRIDSHGMDSRIYMHFSYCPLLGQSTSCGGKMQRFIIYNVFAMTWQHPTFHAKSAQMEFQAVHLYSQLCIIHPKQCKAMGYFELHAANSEAPMTSQKEQQGKSALLAVTICCLLVQLMEGNPFKTISNLKSCPNPWAYLVPEVDISPQTPPQDSTRHRAPGDRKAMCCKCHRTGYHQTFSINYQVLAVQYKHTLWRIIQEPLVANVYWIPIALKMGIW